MNETHFPAMGTTFHAVVPDGESARDARLLVEEAEQRFSRFLPDSELSRINAAATSRPSRDFADVLALAQVARERTRGLVDIGVGGLVTAWGYDRSFDRITGTERRAPIATAPVDWAFDGTTLTKGEGVLLDLGGLVKGWVCDRVVEKGVATVLSGGGDLRSADPGCVVRVRDPWGEDAAVIPLGIGGLATSSVTRRTWMVGDDPAHHLIDPRSGSPSDSPVLQATAIADTAANAEAGAKAILLLGQEGLAWASEQRWIRAALVVWHDGSAYGTTSLELAS